MYLIFMYEDYCVYQVKEVTAEDIKLCEDGMLAITDLTTMRICKDGEWSFIHQKVKL